MPRGSHDVLVSVLRQQVCKLTALQAEALQGFTFGVMTVDEGNEYSARQQHIERIVRQIRKLEGTGEFL